MKNRIEKWDAFKNLKFVARKKKKTFLNLIQNDYPLWYVNE